MKNSVITKPVLSIFLSLITKETESLDSGIARSYPENHEWNSMGVDQE